MASLNLAGKTSGYVKLQAPDDSSNNPTVTLPTESGELALKSDIGEGGGGSGEGETTDILPVLYSGVVNLDGTVKEGTGFTCEKGTAGKYVITLDKPVIDTSSIVVTSNQSEGRNCNTNLDMVSDPTTQFGIVVKSMVNNYVDSTLSFVVTGTETVAVGGGSGGDSKTATWVSFVGDTSPTTLNESNIASIDRVSKGLYHINFKEPMSSDDYAVNCSAGVNNGAASNLNIVGYAIDKTKCYVAMRTVGTTSPVAFESDAVRVSVTAIDSATLSVGSGDSARVKALEARLDKLEKKLLK